jgi:hypothetical protein
MLRWLKLRLKEQQCGKPAMMIALRKTILRRRSSDTGSARQAGQVTYS